MDSLLPSVNSNTNTIPGLERRFNEVVSRLQNTTNEAASCLEDITTEKKAQELFTQTHLFTSTSQKWRLLSLGYTVHHFVSTLVVTGLTYVFNAVHDEFCQRPCRTSSWNPDKSAWESDCPKCSEVSKWIGPAIIIAAFSVYAIRLLLQRKEHVMTENIARVLQSKLDDAFSLGSKHLFDRMADQKQSDLSVYERVNKQLKDLRVNSEALLKTARAMDQTAEERAITFDAILFHFHQDGEQIIREQRPKTQ